MNQILVTGTETRNNNYNNYNNYKTKKEPKKLSIKSIVIFFSISIIILGICLIVGSLYAKKGINETVEANTKPTIDVAKDDENQEVQINVKHIRGITEVAYKWNNEEETIINGNNQKEVKTSINLIGGTNTLTIRVKDESGQTVSYQKQYTSNLAQITLEPVSNGVKVKVTCTNNLKYVTYQWDSNAEQKIDISTNEYEGTLNVQSGTHTLTIQAVDINDNKTTKTEKIVGDTEPTLSLKMEDKDNKKYYIIDAEDDQSIEKVVITIDGVENTVEVNNAKYHNEIEIQDGKENKIKVQVYNINGLEAVRGGRYDTRNIHN